MAKMACAKCGGAKRKMAKGGTANPIVGMPMYGNNPRTQEGRMLKKGGSAASKKCPPGMVWTANGCVTKNELNQGILASRGAKGALAGLVAGAAGMTALAIRDRKKRKAAEKEESMKLVNQARTIKDKLAPKKYGGLAKADSGMQVKPNITRPLPPNTSGVRKKYANGGVTQSFAQNRAVMTSCKNGMVTDANGRCVMERKMALGGVAKKPLRKANNGTTVGSTTPTPIPKQAPMTPVTEAEKKQLQTRWEQVNKRPLPPSANLTPSSENFRTGAGPYSVNITPNQKPVTPPIPAQKRGGAKMAKGGTTKAKKFAALAKPFNKATAADRIAGAKKKKKK